MRAAVGLEPGRLSELLAEALAGRGPALMPVPAGTPDARVGELLTAMRPSSILTPGGESPLADGVRAAPGTALVVTTSGSTGAPKGVELSAAALRASAEASVARIGARPGDSWLCVLPAGHISGLQVMLRALVMGTEAVHAPFSEAASLAAGIHPHVSLVPTQLRRLVAAGVDLSAFGVILLGGAAADPGLLAAARAAGGRVVTTYGMSETCGGCVYDGVPLDGVGVEIEEPAGDGSGRVLLSGPTLLTRYRTAPGVAPVEGPITDADGRRVLRTNDLGRWERDRLTVLGRMDEVINTGGHKVVPGPVNALIAADPAVAESVVVGRPDPEWGERVCAVVVAADPADPPTLERVRALVRERLPAYAAPREVEVRDRLPMLASGKPDLVALRRGRGVDAEGTERNR
ncbi:AMP-binding protein [Nocardiopsis sp. N85]|uniref:AMP-binding protein n=1 Tax=Nocardiopsis sp. N85 TaxID=3029400 RepID=UPI00406CA189